jgi:hypothetical protein
VNLAASIFAQAWTASIAVHGFAVTVDDWNTELTVMRAAALPMQTEHTHAAAEQDGVKLLARTADLSRCGVAVGSFIQAEDGAKWHVARVMLADGPGFSTLECREVGQ